MFDGVGPVVSFSVFLNLSVNLLKSKNLEKWFLPLNNEKTFHDLCPSHLFFEKVIFVIACTKDLPTDNFPNVSQDSDAQANNRHKGIAVTSGRLEEGIDTSDKKIDNKEIT